MEELVEEHVGDLHPPVLKVQDWVQCAMCNKWRKVPKDIAEKLADVETWTCDENTWSEYNTCDKEQEEDDEAL